ncbi:hypothetical protein [Streptomyces sp. NBC_01431]|nr:hypothetical protein [Streptomyces sp. NBC_01431]
MLERKEADALILRHKLGLTPRQASYAMGLEEAQFSLLHSRALHNLST